MYTLRTYHGTEKGEEVKGETIAEGLDNLKNDFVKLSIRVEAEKDGRKADRLLRPIIYRKMKVNSTTRDVIAKQLYNLL